MKIMSNKTYAENILSAYDEGRGQGMSYYDEVKNLYTIICNNDLGDDANSVQVKNDIINRLQQILAKDFRTTQEFHYIISDFLKHNDPKSHSTFGSKMRLKRKALKLSMTELAKTLGITRRQIIRYENNDTPPSPKALQWLNSENRSYGESVTSDELARQRAGDAKNDHFLQGESDIENASLGLLGADK